jgi:heme/copper-type cytochrome/quinol oxidase subunit 1
MFTTVRFFVKASVLFLAVGVLAGLWASLSTYVFHLGVPAEFVSAHTHVILVGSVMMMIMGVALWFFPRPEKDDPRYKPDLIRTVFWMMSASTALRFLFQTGAAYAEIETFRYLIVAAGFGQAAGMLMFFWSIWGRVRPVGSQAREARGEKF